MPILTSTNAIQGVFNYVLISFLYSFSFLVRRAFNCLSTKFVNQQSCLLYTNWFAAYPQEKIFQFLCMRIPQASVKHGGQYWNECCSIQLCVLLNTNTRRHCFSCLQENSTQQNLSVSFLHRKYSSAEERNCLFAYS